jgi:hypothetical protein
MRFYGAQRPTTDVDLLVGRSPENARRLFRAIEKLLGHAPGFTQAQLEEPRKNVYFGRDGYRLDILTSVDGLDFKVAHQSRQHALEKRLAIPVVSKSDLVFIKKAAVAGDERRRIKEGKDIEFLEAL